MKAHSRKQSVPIYSRQQIMIDETDGYDILHMFAEKMTAEHGEQIRGFKISMTSEETQRLANANSPAYGMLFTSSLAGQLIKLDEFFDPRLEAELMFIVHEDLSLAADAEEIKNKCTVAPGLELPDSRYENWYPNLTVGDLLADNTATGKVAVGQGQKQIDSIDLTQISMTLCKDGQQIAAGTAVNVLGNPLNAMTWLTKKLAARNMAIKKGVIISSGTFIMPQPLQKGEYRAVFHDVGEINLTVM